MIYSRDHDRRFREFSLDEALDVIGLWQDVYARLSLEYPVVMTWETSGAEIGQTQPHPHGQTYGVAATPDLLRREMLAIVEASERGDQCPFCAAVERESKGARSVYNGTHWIGYAPSWARYPYQVQLVSRRHFGSTLGFERGGDEARELATALPRIIRAWDYLFEGYMPYMLALHQFADPAYHFHIELLPVGRAPGKLKLPASSEMAWGFWLNDSIPEQKASEIRLVLERMP